MRPCGECRLCCKLFPVPLLDKPAGEWCRHACSAGCAIHAQRPDICRQYDCYWRDHDELPDACRPDRIGVVVTEVGGVNVGRHFLQVLTAQEDFFEAGRGPEAARMLAGFVRQGRAVMTIHGPDARIEFDPCRYPHVSAQEIEAALRYEISQDADELKQMGAVDAAFRPLSREEAAAACHEERMSRARVDTKERCQEN